MFTCVFACVRYVLYLCGVMCVAVVLCCVFSIVFMLFYGLHV